MGNGVGAWLRRVPPSKDGMVCRFALVLGSGLNGKVNKEGSPPSQERTIEVDKVRIEEPTPSKQGDSVSSVRPESQASRLSAARLVLSTIDNTHVRCSFLRRSQLDEVKVDKVSESVQNLGGLIGFPKRWTLASIWHHQKERRAVGSYCIYQDGLARS
ncbi:hypothetical protein ACH5RR_013278 [Cinchona calisaya]|uniref:Uncharacterized protein n=1 Tax=Cinchona calisaya TaxID=153742 RepID=A0ABD3A1S8_9GENT